MLLAQKTCKTSLSVSQDQYQYACKNNLDMYIIYRYDVILQCWEYDPKERPRFSELVTIFSELLDIMAEYFDFSVTYSNEALCK